MKELPVGLAVAVLGAAIVSAAGSGQSRNDALLKTGLSAEARCALVSNVMMAKHDTAKAATHNVR